MPLWRTERLASALLVLCSAAAGGASSGADVPAAGNAAPEKCIDPICLNAGRLEGTPTELVLHDFTILYPARRTTIKGDMAQGARASGESKDTSWVLTGHVEIFTAQGHLTADRATMHTNNGVIANMTAQGMPAEFERNPDSAAPDGGTANTAAPFEHAHGHAREIIYDLEHNELQLNGDSYLSNGCYEFSSEHMSYDIASQRVQADPHDSKGVQGIVRERASSACAGTGKP